MGIKENLHSLDIKDAKLVAVTKDVSADMILEAINYGVSEIGENYVHEAEEKFRKIGRQVKWHFIGHLQRNKVKEAVRIFDVIQSVDSLKLAKKLNREAERQEKIVKIMIQVNISGDKYGIEPEHVTKFYRDLTGLRHIEVIGLMCIGDQHNPRTSFKMMRNLNSRLKLHYLSMGMTSDYSIALEEGSNMVRIGTAIFGNRTKSILNEAMDEVVGMVKGIFSSISERS